MAGALATMIASRHPTGQGRTPPAARHYHCSGESLLCAVACLGLLLRRDAYLCLLICRGKVPRVPRATGYDPKFWI
jgi:hypothetical protein